MPHDDDDMILQRLLKEIHLFIQRLLSTGVESFQEQLDVPCSLNFEALRIFIIIFLHFGFRVCNNGIAVS